MKVVHYEYCLKYHWASGTTQIELVAKRIKHYLDVSDITSTGDIIRVKEPRAIRIANGRSKNIASRYYLGTNIDEKRKQTMTQAPNYPAYGAEQEAGCNKISWRTSLKK